MIPELFFNNLCRSNTCGVIATVISSDGHGPARIGDRLFFSEDRLVAGTVGGGSNEQQVLQACASLATNRRLLDINSFLPGSLPSCGGRLRVMLERIDSSNPAERTFWDILQQLVPGNKPLLLLSSVDESDQTPCFLLLDTNGLLVSTTDGEEDRNISAELRQQLLADKQCSIQKLPTASSQRAFFVQPLNQHGRLILFGAGHVAQEVAWLADRTGFQITIVDPRQELMDAEHFPTACTLFQEAASQFFARNLIGSRDFLVIAGPDHPTDLAVLEQAIATPAPYIGVMGSKGKILSFEQHLRKTEAWHSLADRLHAPIGISISSRTPAEVAVSIVAELIQKRANPSRNL